MATTDTIKQLEKANLLGRGGAAFPTAKKWQLVLDEKAPKKYIVANGSEGELAVFKKSG